MFKRSTRDQAEVGIFGFEPVALSSAIATPMMTGADMPRAQNSGCRSCSDSALLNTPRLMVNMWLAG